jgi:signal peptide peptidase SppA
MKIDLNKYLALLPFERFRNPAPTVAVLRLSGVIGRAGRFQSGIELSALAQSIEAAFSIKGVAAVALAINSPGGAPAQANLVYSRIRAFAAEKEVPVIAFAEDVAASGGYWLACAGDEIYADENSIVGSIGVISASFGFQELLAKIGVERRVHAQGDRKSMLDPFRPETETDLKRLNVIQKDIHANFKRLVHDRRGDRLKISDRKLFSGDVWTGREALDAGLIDGLGEMRDILRQRFGDRVKIKLVGGRTSLFKRLLGRGGAGGGVQDLALSGALSEAAASWPSKLLAAIEERAFWSRFGM